MLFQRDVQRPRLAAISVFCRIDDKLCSDQADVDGAIGGNQHRSQIDPHPS